MIVEHNIKINNRKRLELAMNAARQERDSHRDLITHNLGAVKEKWTVSRILYSAVQENGPAALGGVLASISSMFIQKRDHEGENHLVSLLRTFLATFGRKILKKMD